MESFQNLVLLKSLYRYRALGINYIEPMSINQVDITTLSLAKNINALHAQMSQCHLCDLSKSRKQVMMGYGSDSADLMIIDGSPSMAEDEANNYFSSRSGQSLLKMIENVLGLSVDEIYLTHALKCRPAHHQEVLSSELQSCKPYLKQQIELIKPKVIIALGEDAYRYISDDNRDFNKVRGEKISYEKSVLVPIYHPAYLLRNPSLKKETFNDLKTIKGLI